MITSRDVIISLVALGVGAMLPFIAVTNNHNQDFINYSDNSYVQTEDSHLRNTHRALSQVMFDPKSVNLKNNGNSPNMPYSQWLDNYNGWKNVWIYTGTDIKYVIPMVPASRYSQSGQDVTVSLLFPNGGGFYTGMAANSPVQLSNTLLLELGCIFTNIFLSSCHFLTVCLWKSPFTETTVPVAFSYFFHQTQQRKYGIWYSHLL